MQTYFSPGKLLISGEYLVLDEALALAIPTKLGQSLGVHHHANQDTNTIYWQAFDTNGELWYTQEFSFTTGNDAKVEAVCEVDCVIDLTTERLTKLLNEALRMNPSFLQEGIYEVQSHLDFPNDWGLGSSSTLICNIAKWAEVDAFEISAATFGGSGYDIAVGMTGTDVLFRSAELWEGYVFNPAFKDQLYFVHLNQKKDSSEAVKRYKELKVDSVLIQEISNITDLISVCEDFDEFQELITKHEKIVSEVVGLQPVKELYFSDYGFAIKSLGAWGGDFILACGDENTPAYFENKGYSTVLTYSQLIK